MSVILKAENISKQYRLGTVGTSTLSHDFNRWWHQIRGKEDPYLKVGAVNDRSAKASEDYVWALRDINFEVKTGEVLGIIGKNGAGKSTLLKLLSRVTSPTTGSIKTKGRIASLLEVGTGFHPELTGRENIFLNGAILGMTKPEIKSKIDEIIAFSGCEMYIDTPVKRYSSGMRVRLGFAVAAHLEPEILVVDEVLAVGDTEFQKKAIGKMQDLSTGEGRTVLFVSHNMVSIQQLCTRCLVLKNGSVQFEGNVRESVNRYLHNEEYKIASQNIFPIIVKNIVIHDFSIASEQNSVQNLISGDSYYFIISVENKSVKLLDLNVRFQLFDKNKYLITTLNTYHTNDSLEIAPSEKNRTQCIIEKLAITAGKYTIGVQLLDLKEREVLYENEKFYSFQVTNGDFYKTGKLPSNKNLGFLLSEYKWQKLEDL